MFWTSERLRLLVDSPLSSTRASGFLSPASSSLVVIASLPPSTTDFLPSARCACGERLLLEILQRDDAFSSSSLAVIMALHELPTMALRGTPWLPGVASREPLFPTSCSPVHVLTHVFSFASFSRARLLWHIVVLVDLLD